MGTLSDIATPDPASNAVAGDCYPVTPADGTDQPKTFRALRANTAGTISILTAAGTTRVCNFLAGETRNIAGSRVHATNTTATGIEAMT